MLQNSQVTPIRYQIPRANSGESRNGKRGGAIENRGLGGRREPIYLGAMTLRVGSVDPMSLTTTPSRAFFSPPPAIRLDCLLCTEFAFQGDLYPLTRSPNEAAIDSGAWFGGENADPVLVSLKPDDA